LIHHAQEGWTALMFAARDGDADCARLLLEAGADTNAKNNVRASAGFAYFAMLHGAMFTMVWSVKVAAGAICISSNRHN
jgi:ankyrin repeat protein